MLGDIRLEHLKGNSVRIRNSARYCELFKILNKSFATVLANEWEGVQNRVSQETCLTNQLFTYSRGQEYFYKQFIFILK